MHVISAPGERALPATASLAVEELEARMHLAVVAELAVQPPAAEVPGMAEPLTLASAPVQLTQMV